jgi:hypothetical protein
MRGGYQLVNLQDNNFTVDGAGITIPGIFDIIERCHDITGKDTIMSKYQVGGAHRPDTMVRFIVDGDNFTGGGGYTSAGTGDVGLYLWTVTPDDLVTIARVDVTSA